jgi:propanol-preferring alcohol dehydrogenase
MQIAAQAPIVTHTTAFALSDANQALTAMRSGSVEGAAVLVP